MTLTEIEDRLRHTYRTVIPVLIDAHNRAGDDAGAHDHGDSETIEFTLVPIGERIRSPYRGGRPRAPRRVPFAIVAAAVVLIGGVVWAASDDSRAPGPVGVPTSVLSTSPSTALAVPTTPPVPAEPWAPTAVPSGWGFMAADTSGLALTPSGTDAVFVTSNGTDRAVSVGVWGGAIADVNDFTDPITINGHIGEISSPSPTEVHLRLNLDDHWVDIYASGLTETAVTDLARSIKVTGTSTELTFDAAVPPSMSPWTRWDDRQVVTSLIYLSGDPSQASSNRFLTTIIVTGQPDLLRARLVSLAGPLAVTVLPVDATDTVEIAGVSTADTGTVAPEWAGFRETRGRGIGIIGGALTPTDITGVLASMQPLTPDQWHTATTPDNSPTPDGSCVLRDPPPNAVRVPLAVDVEVFAFPAGTVVCVVEHHDGQPASGTTLHSVTHDRLQRSFSRQPYALGLVPARTSTVRLHLDTSPPVDVTAHPMTDTTSVWIAPLPTDRRIRAIDTLDATGNVLTHTGRPTNN